MKNKNPKYFRIHKTDVGAEAYADWYVERLEDENKELIQLLDDFRGEARMYCRPTMVNYDMFPVFKQVDEFFKEREA